MIEDWALGWCAALCGLLIAPPARLAHRIGARRTVLRQRLRGRM